VSATTLGVLLAVPWRPSPAASGDAALLAAVRDGDVAKFRDLYRRHMDRVYAQLTRLVGPVPEREDLMQHIFLDVYRAIPAFRGEATFGTFLFRIVVNVAYEHLRRSRRYQALSAEDMDELVDPAASPEARARHREELCLLFDLLRRVKPKKRVAFVLVAVEGMSYEDAAALVGANAPAVKQRVLAARREVEAMLAKVQP
jgi:RNA polymerase sigma-70 factor (ECF subfamily)